MKKPIKKFKDFNLSKYFEIQDFNTKIEVNSPTYGKYLMTKILIVDMISACEDKNLIDAYNFYHKIMKELTGSKSIILDSKNFGGTLLYKWEIYTPFREDNKNWEDPKGYYKKGNLPVGYNKTRIFNMLNTLIK